MSLIGFRGSSTRPTMNCCARPARRPDDSARSVKDLDIVAQLGANVQLPGPTKAVVHTNDSIPLSLQFWPNGTEDNFVRVSKSTYAANAPSEDRCTIFADSERNCIFAGVYDGHAGGRCAEWVDQNIYGLFCKELEAASGDAAAAMEAVHMRADQRYIAEAEKARDTELMCCGTCAVSAYVALSGHDKSTVTVGNLGDSRAILGEFVSGHLYVEELSNDHSCADSTSERQRLRTEFPDEPRITVMPDSHADADEDEHGTVMGLCRFTRSIGDCHMKSPVSADAFNTWHAAHRTGQNIKPPPPGKQYISSAAECRVGKVTDGFLLLACDGIWDEMSSDEAGRICSELLVQTAFDKSANVAERFVDEVLKMAAARIRDDYDEEENLTVQELRRRPHGKAPGARSLLHDDMTVVIIDFVTPSTLAARAAATNTAMLASPKLSAVLSPMSGATRDTMIVEPMALDNDVGTSIWIGGIPHHMVEGGVHAASQRLLEVLQSFGSTLASTVRIKPGESKSWAIMSFTDSEGAARALAAEIMSTPDPASGATQKLVLRRVAAEEHLGKSNTGALASILSIHAEAVRKKRQMEAAMPSYARPPNP